MDDPCDRLALVHGLRTVTRWWYGGVDDPTYCMAASFEAMFAALKDVNPKFELSLTALTPALEAEIREDERFDEFAHAKWRLELVDARPSVMN